MESSSVNPMSLITASRRALGAILIGLGVLFGLLLWAMYMIALVDWIGAVGFLVAVIAVPGIVIFPVAYWVIEGTIPVTYFAFLFAGILLPPLGANMLRS
jgi:hypothetical protein